MDLVRHLRYFVVVAEELHFGRAAERLHMSQPPLSQRIRSLEERAGGPLFERTSRRVEITPLGRRLLPEARALTEHADRVGRLLDELGSSEAAELAVGVPEGLAAPFVARLLAACAAEQPDVHVELVPGSPAELAASLASGAVQVALLHHPLPPDLAHGRTLERPLGVLAGSDTPIGTEHELEVFDLSGQSLVLPAREQAPAQYDRVLSDLRALGCVPAAVRPAASAALLEGEVLARGAVAIVEEPRTPVEGLRWRALTGEPLVLRASVAWAAAGAGQAAARSVAEALEELLWRHGGWRPAGGRAGVPTQERPSAGLLT